jgi:hypothetical protein
MSQAHDPFLSHACSSSDSDVENSHSSSPIFRKTKTRPSNHHQQRRHLFAALIFGCCVITGWFLGMATLYAFKVLVPEPDVFHPETLAHGTNLCDCGANIEEALQLDCVYDTLSTSWLPPYCRDAELTAKFDKAGDDPNGEWSYFADQQGTHRLSVKEIAALGDTGGHFWASRYWHRAHCLFYWQKQFRQRDTRVVMEQRFDGLKHVEHCTHLLLRTTEMQQLIPVPVLMNSSAADAARLSPEGHDDHSHHMLN